MSEPDFKCGTFSSDAIPPEIRARMDADRRAAENRYGEPEAIELERVLSQLRRREVPDRGRHRAAGGGKRFIIDVEVEVPTAQEIKPISVEEVKP